MNEYLREVKRIWNDNSDNWYTMYRTDAVIDRIWNNPATSFHSETYKMIRSFLPDLSGKRVLVPSSGDNHAVFSFALMGAKVTSADISERQIENAAEIAKEHGLDIEFVCDDTMELTQIDSGAYDLVYTSNGVHVWIYDLDAMYRNIHRVLKDGGHCVMYDVHPFNRPFYDDDSHRKLEIIKRYEDIKTEYHHWRVMDLMNAMLGAGFALRRVEELKAENEMFWFVGRENDVTREEIERMNDWHNNPLAALPQWLSIGMQKL